MTDAPDNSPSAPVVGQPHDKTFHKLPEVEFVEFRRWAQADVIPHHTHKDLFQLDYFSEGEGTYAVDGEAHPIDPVTFFLVSPGHDHEIIGSSEAPLVNLTVKFRQTELGAHFLPIALAMEHEQVQKATRLFRAMISEAVLDVPERRVVAALRLAELLLFLRRIRDRGQEAGATPTLGEAAQQFIREHFAEPLSLRDVAAALGVSGAHLCRVFQKETRTTPFAFLRSVRVEQTRRHVEQTTRKLSDIAAAAGFGTTKAMNRAFHTELGMSPREYRRRARRADGG